MGIPKKFKHLSSSIVTLCYLFISTGCEPDPKLIGYGSNEFSQLEILSADMNEDGIINIQDMIIIINFILNNF